MKIRIIVIVSSLFFSAPAWSKLKPDIPLQPSVLKTWPVGTIVYESNLAKQVLAKKLVKREGDNLFWEYHTGCQVQTKTDPFIGRLSWKNCGNWFGKRDSGKVELKNYRTPWPLKKGEKWQFSGLRTIADKDAVKSEDVTGECESFGNEIVGLPEGTKVLHKVKCRLGYETVVSYIDDEMGGVYYQEKSYRGISQVQKLWYLEAKLPKSKNLVESP